MTQISIIFIYNYQLYIRGPDGLDLSRAIFYPQSSRDKDLNLTRHEEKGRATVYRTDLGHWGSGMAATHTHHPGSGPVKVQMYNNKK